MQPNLPPPQLPNQPEQASQPSQFSSPAADPAPMDYLDSISTSTQVKKLNPILLWGIILGVLGIAFVLVFALFGAGTSQKEELTSYSLRVSSLLDVSEEAQENIQTNELRTINSSLSLVLAGAKQGAAKFQTEKVKKKSQTYQAITVETAKLSQDLEDARLNAVYDRTYARELRFNLSKLRTQMVVIYEKTNNQALKNYLEETDSNLKRITTQLSSFNAD